MPSTFTTILEIEKPATGEQVDAWGPTVNANMDIIDALFENDADPRLKISAGGTGANNEADARAALGLGSASAVQFDQVRSDLFYDFLADSGNNYGANFSYSFHASTVGNNQIALTFTTTIGMGSETLEGVFFAQKTGALANLALLATSAAASFGGGKGVVFLPNCNTVPGSNPTGGGIFYVDGGALKYRGSSGTVSTLAPA